MLTVIIAIVSKEVCYDYEDEQRRKKVLQWMRKEKLGIFFGVLYVIVTSWYVAIFIFMTPSYATWSYLQAKRLSLLQAPPECKAVLFPLSAVLRL